MGFLLLGLLPPPTDRPTTDRPTDRPPPPTDRPTTDRPTDRPPPRSELLLAPPLSFFYTHTRHTHVDSLTHTRQTHTRSLTVPFAHGARAGASLDTHTVDAHTFAHGARARFTLDTHLGASRLVSAGRGSTSGSGRCPSAFRGPPPLMLPGAALGSLAARFCWKGGSTSGSGRCPSAFRGPLLDAARRSTWEPRGSFLLAARLVSAGRGSTSGSGGCPSAFRAPPPLMLPPGAALGSLAARFCWQGQHFRLWTVPERVMLRGAALASLAARFCWQGQHVRLWTVPERVSGALTDLHLRTHLFPCSNSQLYPLLHSS